jgi:hypothetical protein
LKASLLSTSKEYRCDVCSTSFETEVGLIRHKNDAHGGKDDVKFQVISTQLSPNDCMWFLLYLISCPREVVSRGTSCLAERVNELPLFNEKAIR